ncbi:hypothetical protein [uncultured Alistipes sp.]|uniref:hypothetical protein n=1 Tax=uncultured Alistipes sp. TaxID=538949 RepID=UPI00260BB134|nr:hypothetical protein [uncultured Alistipes sp.]
MTAQNHEKRLKEINKGLKRGDKRRIAERAEVSWVWVSYVLAGRGTSERILQIAESMIRENSLHEEIGAQCEEIQPCEVTEQP